MLGVGMLELLLWGWLGEWASWERGERGRRGKFVCVHWYFVVRDVEIIEILVRSTAFTCLYTWLETDRDHTRSPAP